MFASVCYFSVRRFAGPLHPVFGSLPPWSAASPPTSCQSSIATTNSTRCAYPQRGMLVCDALWPRYTRALSWRPPSLVVVCFMETRIATTVVRDTTWLVASSGDRVDFVFPSQITFAPSRSAGHSHNFAPATGGGQCLTISTPRLRCMST